MEETISLREVTQILKKRISLIITLTVLAAFTSGMVSYFLITPVYQSSTQILVNQENTEQQLYNSSEVQANLQLINTYSVIITSPAVLEKVAENLEIGLTANQIAGKIFVSSAEDSQVMNVSVADISQARATAIANETAAVFQEEIINIMNVDNVSILAAAEIQENPVPLSPNPSMNIIIAAVVGLLAGIGIALLLEYMDHTIKTEQDVERVLGLPLLGAVATIEAKNVKHEKPHTLEPKEAGGEGIGI